MWSVVEQQFNTIFVCVLLLLLLAYFLNHSERHNVYLIVYVIWFPLLVTFKSPIQSTTIDSHQQIQLTKKEIYSSIPALFVGHFHIAHITYHVLNEAKQRKRRRNMSK